MKRGEENKQERITRNKAAKFDVEGLQGME